MMIAAIPGTGLAQEVIYLIRHAERAEGENPAITAAGRERAARWAKMLSAAQIAHVYTSTARRTMETGAIIAEAIGVETEAVETGDTAGLLDLMAFDFEDARVLVVGHTETIPGLLSALGASDPIRMPRDDYGRMFAVIPGADTPTVIDMRMP